MRNKILPILLLATSLSISPGCEKTEKTNIKKIGTEIEIVQNNLGETLSSDPIHQGNNIYTTKKEKNDTTNVNKDIYTQLSEHKEGIDFTEKLKLYIGRLLIALGYPAAGALGYMTSRRKLEKMLHGEYGKNTGQLLKFLSNEIPLIKISNIRQEIRMKNQEFSLYGTIPEFTKDHEKIQILINKFLQHLINLEENYNYDKIIENTENFMNRYIEFREVVKYYRQLKDNYCIRIKELNNELSKLEKASNRKTENTKNHTDQDKLLDEYNKKIGSANLLYNEVKRLYDHLNYIEDSISPMFDPKTRGDLKTQI